MSEEITPMADYNEDVQAREGMTAIQRELVLRRGQQITLGMLVKMSEAADYPLVVALPSWAWTAAVLVLGREEVDFTDELRPWFRLGMTKFIPKLDKPRPELIEIAEYTSDIYVPETLAGNGGIMRL